jgi:SAM-dependent methyltransferase
VQDDDSPLDPAALIAALDGAGHVARAEAYFAGLAEDDPTFRKPFHDPARVATAMGNLFTLFSGLRPARGMAVLDHGCGTGWLTRILALLGMKAVGCDVSATVLAQAEAFARRHEPELGKRLRFIRSPDGVAIPLPDGAVERAVMHGAFHHVHDQAATLREMARVLAEDGRAVFIEPGPQHSRTPDSQAEMRKHGVIENDIVIERIWRDAQAAGFDGIEMALGLAEVPFVPLASFRRQAARAAERRPPEAAEIAPVVQRLDRQLVNARHFVLTMPGGVQDTRRALEERQRHGPPGRIEVLSAARDEKGLLLRVALHNTSRLRWRPAGGDRGAVNLGVQLWRDGALLKRDFRRIAVADAPTEPGARREVSFALPVTRPGDRYRLDLVAEQVCWFTAPVERAEKIDQALPER